MIIEFLLLFLQNAVSEKRKQRIDWKMIALPALPGQASAFASLSGAVQSLSLNYWSIFLGANKRFINKETSGGGRHKLFASASKGADWKLCEVESKKKYSGEGRTVYQVGI